MFVLLPLISYNSAMAVKKVSDYPSKKKALVQSLEEGNLAPCCLIYGEEDYLRSADLKLIKEKLGVSENDMNFSIYEGPGLSADEITEMAMTPPFLSPVRVIVITDSGWMSVSRKGKKASADDDGASGGNSEGKKFAEYVKAPSPDTRVIFVERDVNRTTALYKALDKHGFTLSCDPPEEKDLVRWVAGRVKREGLEISLDAVNSLMARVAGGAANDPRIDMNMLANETEKLICFCMNRGRITQEDVSSICSDVLMDSVFRMVDLMADKDIRGASALYQDMMALKLEPVRLLALITRQFDMILQAAEMDKAHSAPGDIAAALGLHPKIVYKYISWGKKYNSERLTDILNMCIETDAAIKRGRADRTAALELLIASCAGRT